MHKEENLVLTPFKLLFSDFMHNMRGGVEGYAWESDEDADKMKKNFYAFLEELKKKGFSDSGECLYLKR